MLDIKNLTLGEIATVEKLGGYPLAALGEDDTPQGNMLAALAMIAKRRDGFPAFKWGDAIALTMQEAMDICGFNAEDDSDSDDAGGQDPADALARDVADAERAAEAEEAPPAPKAGKSRAKR